MQCISPIKASFDSNNNITFKSTQATRELEGFQFECRKCLPCRLNNAREKAIRCIHEAKMHGDNNIFLTLTYNEESLKSPRLQYLDIQLFFKKLRKKVTKNVTDKDLKEKLKITYMLTGEYGELNKRPHWHAIVFNYRPKDEQYKYTTERDEKVWTSKELTELWGKGAVEYGSVTMDSAGYVARYAAKKLVHGKDQEHDYHPIHKTSSKRAIGRSWIEKYWKHTFENGFVVLPNGAKSKIPRYYVDWLKKYKFDEYLKYHFGIKKKIIKLAEATNRKEELEFLSNTINYQGGASYPLTRPKVKETILKSKFKQLQEKLKL